MSEIDIISKLIVLIDEIIETSPTGIVSVDIAYDVFDRIDMAIWEALIEARQRTGIVGETVNPTITALQAMEDRRRERYLNL